MKSVIRSMYKDSIVRLIIGKNDTSIPFNVGVKQGNSMVPVLFLFIIISFAETLEEEWIKNDLHQLQFRKHDNSPLSKGRISNHPKKSFSEGSLFELLCMLYVDDGTFAFKSRQKNEIGSTIIQLQFRRFRLKMHVGSNTKASKTEAVLF